MGFFKKRWVALGWAASGLAAAARREVHVGLQLASAVVVTGAGFYFNINRLEWCAVIICMALVIGSEIVNSALEKLCDLVMPHEHPTVKYIKDIAAGTVLLTCIVALIVGLLVFIPHIREQLP